MSKQWFFDYEESKINDINTFVENNIDKDWDWNELSANIHIFPLFLKYSDKGWNIRKIFSNPTITFDNMRKYRKLYELQVNWKRVSDNKNLTIDFIEKYINKNWNWGKLLDNNIITKEFLEDCIGNSFDWNFVSKHKIIYWPFISKYNLIISQKFIEKYIDKQWEWNYLYIKNMINMKFIKKHNINIDKQIIENINMQSTTRLSTLINVLPKSYDINIIKMINNFIPYIYDQCEAVQHIPFKKYNFSPL